MLNAAIPTGELHSLLRPQMSKSAFRTDHILNSCVLAQKTLGDLNALENDLRPKVASHPDSKRCGPNAQAIAEVQPSFD